MSFIRAAKFAGLSRFHVEGARLLTRERPMISLPAQRTVGDWKLARWLVPSFVERIDMDIPRCVLVFFVHEDKKPFVVF